MKIRFLAGGVGAGADAGVKAGPAEVGPAEVGPAEVGPAEAELAGAERAGAGPLGAGPAGAEPVGALPAIRVPHLGQKTESAAIMLWHFGQRLSVTMRTPHRGQKEDPSGSWELHFGHTIFHSSFHWDQGTAPLLDAKPGPVFTSSSPLYPRHKGKSM